MIMEVYTTESSELTSLYPFLAFTLVGFSRSIVNDVLDKCHATTLQKINWLLEMEAASTFTLNEDYFSDYRQKFLESYGSARAENREGNEDLCLEQLIACDRFGPALNIMASVRGYFEGRPNRHSHFPSHLRLAQCRTSGSRT